MSHPLINDLTQLTTEELHAKFADLTKKISQAYRLGMGDAIQQLNMLREDYQFEMNKRATKALDEAMNKSKEFKNIIDIN